MTRHLFKGIDVAVPLTNTQCKALKEAKYKFVCRYYTDYSNPRHTWKLISKNEAQMISNAGLDIVAVYEARGPKKTYSRKTGKQDCINAINCAEKIGQPCNSTIYFAVDSRLYYYDNSKIKNLDEYFKGINEEMVLYKKTSGYKGWDLGIYGSYCVVEYMYNKCSILHFWQTAAWSNGKISDKAHFLQYKLNTSDCHINPVDIDLAYDSSFGQFRV